MSQVSHPFANTIENGSGPRPSSDSFALPFNFGDVIGGKYRVDTLLGVGGMGYVVEALHIELDERVALKFLRPDVQKDQDVVARFAREARASAKIKNEHVARVHDVGVDTDAGPFLVMEYLEGRDLAAELRERGALPFSEVAEYVIHACDALAAAHVNGIVHRDIKPENLFLAQRSEGRVLKVLDFGISKVALTGSAFGAEFPLVKTSSLLGSPFYMSPEQIRGTKDVDFRSDIWSLGVVLYELITRRSPFDSQSITELCALVLEVEPEPIAAHRPDVPDDFDAIVRRCLAKNPDERFPTVAELAFALLPFAPKRSRATAERISMVLRKAGFTRTELLLPSTLPPPPAAPMLQSGELFAMPSSVRAIAPMAQPPQQQPASRKGLYIAAVLFGLVVVMGLVIAQRMQRESASASTPAAAGAAPVAATAERAPPAPLQPGAAVAAPSPPAVTAAQTTAASPATATPSAKATVLTPKGPVPARPLPSVKRTADEPDLGY